MSWLGPLLVALMPLLKMLLERLLNAQRLNVRQQRKLNEAQWYMRQIGRRAVAFGCKAEGEPPEDGEKPAA